MPSENIQWFPGHMAKTRRMISENLKNVDIVIEILDARIPLSSRNPEITRLTEGKPSLIILNKASLADPTQNKAWVEHYSTESSACILVDCLTGEGLNKILAERTAGWSYCIDICMGYAEYRGPGSSLPNWLAEADVELYENKRARAAERNEQLTIQ